MTLSDALEERLGAPRWALRRALSYALVIQNCIRKENNNVLNDMFRDRCRGKCTSKSPLGDCFGHAIMRFLRWQRGFRHVGRVIRFRFVNLMRLVFMAGAVENPLFHVCCGAFGRPGEVPRDAFLSTGIRKCMFWVAILVGAWLSGGIVLTPGRWQMDVCMFLPG